jgi:hypothetical protein
MKSLEKEIAVLRDLACLAIQKSLRLERRLEKLESRATQHAKRLHSIESKEK